MNQRQEHTHTHSHADERSVRCVQMCWADECEWKREAKCRLQKVTLRNTNFNVDGWRCFSAARIHRS